MKTIALPNNAAEHAKIQAAQLALYLRKAGFVKISITLIFLEAIEEASKEYENMTKVPF